MTEEDNLYASELRNRALSDYERLDSAINELERQTCDTPRNNLAETSQDCISREEAIDAITKIHPVDTEYDCTLYDKLDVMYVLKDLPSVTPSIPDVENNFNLGYNCGYADAMSDIAESEE